MSLESLEEKVANLDRRVTELEAAPKPKAGFDLTWVYEWIAAKKGYGVAGLVGSILTGLAIFFGKPPETKIEVQPPAKVKADEIKDIRKMIEGSK